MPQLGVQAFEPWKVQPAVVHAVQSLRNELHELWPTTKGAGGGGGGDICAGAGGHPIAEGVRWQYSSTVIPWVHARHCAVMPKQHGPLCPCAGASSRESRIPRTGARLPRGMVY